MKLEQNLSHRRSLERSFYFSLMDPERILWTEQEPSYSYSTLLVITVLKPKHVAETDTSGEEIIIAPTHTVIPSMKIMELIKNDLISYLYTLISLQEWCGIVKSSTTISRRPESEIWIIRGRNDQENRHREFQERRYSNHKLQQLRARLKHSRNACTRSWWATTKAP